MDAPIRVLIVEDHMVARMGLRTLIDHQPDMKVVGEARTGSDGVQLAQTLSPSVIVMDLRLPGLDGIAATQLILKQNPQARVLVFSSFDAEHDLRRAREAGACGYILKTAEGNDLLDAVRALNAGLTFFPANIARRMDNETSAELGPRDRQLLAFLIKGLNNREIAEVSGLTRGTVRIYLTRLFNRLQVTNRTEAVAAAYQLGLERPDWAGADDSSKPDT